MIITSKAEHNTLMRFACVVPTRNPVDSVIVEVRSIGLLPSRGHESCRIGGFLTKSSSQLQMKYLLSIIVSEALHFVHQCLSFRDPPLSGLLTWLVGSSL